MKSEPVAIIGAIMAVVMALITFGVISWSDLQVDAFEQALVALVPIVIVGIGSAVQRAKVFSPKTVETQYVKKDAA